MNFNFSSNARKMNGNFWIELLAYSSNILFPINTNTIIFIFVTFYKHSERKVPDIYFFGRKQQKGLNFIFGSRNWKRRLWFFLKKNFWLQWFGVVYWFGFGSVTCTTVDFYRVSSTRVGAIMHGTVFLANAFMFLLLVLKLLVKIDYWHQVP